MVHSRAGNETEPKKPPLVKHRANPVGLGRLLLMTATVGLLTLGHGVLWWAGLLLMALILLAVGRQGRALWGMWSLVGIMAALAFWHLHMIPQWIGLTFLGLAAVQFAMSLVARET
jgi:hypothetical protein